MEDDIGNRSASAAPRSNTIAQSSAGTVGASAYTGAGSSIGAFQAREKTNFRAGEIVALRAWAVRRNGHLYSVYFDKFEWFPDRPVEGDPLRVSATWSAEGIHAFKHQHDLDCYLGWGRNWSPSDELLALAWGEVELFGIVMEHEMGYRAQYGKVLKILGVQPDMELWMAQADMVNALNRRYCA